MREIDEIIEEIMKSLCGKSAEQKILIVESQLNVKLADVETGYSFDKIKGIIKARIKEPCPVCGSEIKDKKCSDCKGSGYVTAVEAERILLRLK